MKKVLLFFSSLFLLSACGNTDEPTANGGGSESTTTPTTEVYLSTNGSSTKASESYTATDAIDAPKEAHFFIRLDNRIPGAENYSSKEYFPQTAMGKSVFDNLNKGTINLNYPTWSTNNSYKFYVYDTTGKVTEQAVTQKPDLKDIISANKNYEYELSKINTDTLKVLWYIVKLQEGKWHVDGVLTGKSTKDATEVPGIDEDENLDNKKENTEDPKPDTTGKVEVDIHQQEHTTWEEIKTSIHIREFVQDLTVVIPIGKDFVAEADDFCLREYTFYTGKDNISNTHPIKVIVTHKTDKIEISVHCDAPEYINDLMTKYGDGATIEIHSYTNSSITRENAWKLIQQSTATRSDNVELKPQTSSAYFNK